MKAYSADLRQRIVHAAINDGLSHPEDACRFLVSLRTVERSVHQWRTTGDLTARHSPGAPPAVTPRHYPTLIAQLAADERDETARAAWQQDEQQL